MGDRDLKAADIYTKGGTMFHDTSQIICKLKEQHIELIESVEAMNKAARTRI